MLWYCMGRKATCCANLKIEKNEFATILIQFIIT